MALLNNSPVGFDLRDRTPMSVQFETARRRVTEKKQQLEDIKNEYELLQNQEFLLYKKNISYDFEIFTPLLIEDARVWLKMKAKGCDKDGNKLDGRRRYDEKFKFEMLERDFKNAFGVEELEITSIASLNFDQAWDIYFTLENQEWMLRIPIIQHIDIRAYQNDGIDVFKLELFKHSGIVNSRVGATFEEKELKDIMSKALEVLVLAV